MYPNLYFLVRDWFGADLKGLRFANMFGLMVAIAFICAAVVIGAELKRKSKEGLLHFQEEKITVGKPASIGELIINFLLGFLFGYKVIGAFFSDPNGDMQQFMLSTQGNLLARSQQAEIGPARRTQHPRLAARQGRRHYFAGCRIRIPGCEDF